MSIHTRPCGCNSYNTRHNSWCEDTPIFAKLTKDHGGNPFDVWPFIVCSLIGPSTNLIKRKNQ